MNISLQTECIDTMVMSIAANAIRRTCECTCMFTRFLVKYKMRNKFT